MAGMGFAMLKRLSSSVNSSSRVMAPRGYSIRDGMRFGEPYYAHIRPAYSHENRGYHAAAQAKLWNVEALTQPNQGKSSDFSGFPNTLLNSRVRSKFPLISVSPTLTYHSFWSSAGKNEDDSRGPDVPEAGKGDNGIVNVDGIDGGEWGVKVKDAWHSVVDGVGVAGNKAKEVYGELIPYGQQVLDSHPYLRDLVVSVGGTLTAATMAWLVMPLIFKRLHKYSQQGTAKLLLGTTLGGEVPYEKSVWGALEDPVRYSLTFLAFTQIGMILAPDTITPEYVSQALRGAAVMSLLWFLYRWKTNIFSRALTAQSVSAFDRERLVAFDKVTSVGIVFLGMMALAEASGVAFQSILTVGGIGGVATAFAAKDVLGNVLSGLSMQFSTPFSLGDTIKAGSIEGQVVEMGLTTTSLLNAEKFPVIVPNSLFSSQVIVNKSRAQWRAIVSTIPLQFHNLDKIPQISDDIKSMLRSNPKVFLGREAPYCFLSRIESSFAELTLGCNLTHMSKDELVATKQDILLQTVEIIKQHGATLGSTWQDSREP